MLKRIALWAVVGMGVVLAGCIVPSVYPYYTEKDVVTDPALLGSWVKAGGDANDKSSWLFEKSGEQAYKATIVDNETNFYSVHLFKLKDQMFMDAMLLLKSGAGIPPHYLMKVAQIQPTLKTATVNYQWMDEYLEKHPDAIRHTIALDDPQDTNTAHTVLTAETKELQKFFLKHLDDTNLFGDFDEMKRADSGKH